MLLIALSIITVTLASPTPDDRPINIATIMHAEKTCLATFPAELKDIINEAKKNGKLPENPSDDFKCFMNCMGKELGVIDENGNYHFDKLKSVHLEGTNHKLSHEEVHQVVTECIEVDHDHACEKAHLYVMCAHDKFSNYELHDDLKMSTT